MRVFRAQDISVKDKEAILQCACQAPTAGNQQLYTILDITDPDLQKQLSETCDHQPFIAEAKMVLIFCADCKRWLDAYRLAGCQPRQPGAGDFLLAVCDAMIAAQNAVIAAQSLLIGSCYIGDIMEQYETHRSLLSLPEYVFPVGMVVFGYPTQAQKDRISPKRFDLADIVHTNGYRRQSEEQLKEMFRAKIQNRAFTEWIRAFCQRKYQSDFAREMSRSVRAFMDTLGG